MTHLPLVILFLTALVDVETRGPATVAPLCDCVKPTLEEALEVTNLVFEGQVWGVSGDGYFQPNAGLGISRVFKGGDLPTGVLVWGGAFPGTCGYWFEAGRRYLIYASVRPFDSGVSMISTSICHHTKPIEEVSEHEWGLLWDYRERRKGAGPGLPVAPSGERE